MSIGRTAFRTCLALAGAAWLVRAGIAQAGAVRSGMTKIRGAELYYESAGDGPPLVMIHSGGFDRRIWDDQFQAFAAHYRVIRYDVRGFGKSSPGRGDYADAEDLQDLLGSLQLQRVNLMGLSLGARIALDFALEHPEKAGALVLVGPGISGYTFSDDFLDRWGAIVAAARMEGPERAAQLWLDGPLFEQARKDSAAFGRLRTIAQENAGVWLRNPAGGRPAHPPALGRLSTIRQPTLVIVGDKDGPDIREAARLLTQGIPNARNVVIPGADHAANMEKPAEFNRVVADFLGRREGVKSENR